MSADEKDRFIQYLVDKVNTYELDKRATELAVEEFQSTFDSVSASLESLKKEMEEINIMDVEISLVWQPQIYVWLMPNIVQTSIKQVYLTFIECSRYS